MQPGVLSAIKVTAATEKYLLMGSGGFLGAILTVGLPDARIFSHPSIAGSQRTAKGSLLIHQGQAATWCFAKENDKNGTSDAGLQETASLCRIFWNALSKKR
jgi:hypothetical protein